MGQLAPPAVFLGCPVSGIARKLPNGLLDSLQQRPHSRQLLLLKPYDLLSPIEHLRPSAADRLATGGWVIKIHSIAFWQLTRQNGSSGVHHISTGIHQGTRQQARRWDRSQQRPDVRRPSNWRGIGASQQKELIQEEHSLISLELPKTQIV